MAHTIRKFSEKGGCDEFNQGQAAACGCYFPVGNHSVYHVVSDDFSARADERAGWDIREISVRKAGEPVSSETVYLKISQITEVYERNVSVKDIAEVHCQNPAVEAKIKTVRVTSFPEHVRKSMFYVGSIMELIKKLEQAGQNVEINSLGEADFVIKYMPSPLAGKTFQWLKTAVVCAVAFFGAGFAIMTFNNDASVTDVFAKLYEAMTGIRPSGPTILELSYSIGLAAGILVFFNHFASWKITVDPTPIEVEMRLYEENLNKALIQNHGRKERSIDVS